MCETCHKALTDMNEHMTAQTQLMRSLLQHQQTMIPKFLQNCRLYLSNATTLNFQYHFQSQLLMNVTSVLITATSPATLQIAERTFPANGFTTLMFGSENGLIIRPEDLIILTQTSAGALGLELLGYELPDRGARW